MCNIKKNKYSRRDFSRKAVQYISKKLAVMQINIEERRRFNVFSLAMKICILVNRNNGINTLHKQSSFE